MWGKNEAEPEGESVREGRKRLSQREKELEGVRG